ncbi:MAG: S8 family serine peptidase [Caldilineaceae bacterium]
MTKLIALRASPTLHLYQSILSVEEKRLSAVNSTLNHGKTELLHALGLTQVEPTDHAPKILHTFQRLDYMKAFVIETPNPAVAERARELLEPDYLVLPDLRFTLPMPEIFRRYARRPRGEPYWPESSGVALAHQQDILGQGVLVGVLDTGCDADHLELRNKVIDFRYIPLDPTSDAVRTCRAFDVDGHGTHVAGIIAGRHVGVAPAVDLMVASVIESETLHTSLERVVIALNWMLAKFQLEENLHKPTIINLSLGFLPEWIGQGQAATVSRGIQQILNTLVVDYNVLPIVAIGNDGPGRMRAPAYFPETLSVGAVDQHLQPAPFSGGGRSPLVPENEPDLVGYGVDILSSLERTIEGRSVYATASGTSMAAPYVTGIAALLASMDPTLQGQKLRQHLLDHAVSIDAPSDRVGAGLARFG